MVDVLADLPGEEIEALVVPILQELISVPSVNPDQIEDPSTDPNANERRFAELLSRHFTELGGEVTLEYLTPERPNMYAIFRSADEKSSKWLCVDVHSDTVSVAHMPGDPFCGTIDAEGKLHGRGSCDTKASLALCIGLLRRLKSRGEKLTHNLIVASTVGEETTTLGADAFREWLKAQNLCVDELVVAEPTMCIPIYGHKGLTRLRIDMEGLAAHSSLPHLGRNALTAAAELACALNARHAAIQSNVSAIGPPTLTPTLLSAGSGINIVPHTASLSLDRRVVKGEKPADVTASLKEFISDSLDEASQVVDHTVTTLCESDHFYQDPEDTWVKSMAVLCKAEPQLATYGTNASAYNHDMAKAMVILGPGSIEQAHQADEWILVSELVKYWRIMARWWAAE